MALWEPSLLMSIYNVRLTGVCVKDKTCIYNNLRRLNERRPGRLGYFCSRADGLTGRPAVVDECK